MKESDDYRSKKALAIGAGIAAAVVVAVGGTVAFIKSRPASTAVNNVVENQITNSATANETNSTQNISINNEVTNTSANSTSNDGNTISNTTTNNTTTNSNSTNTATNNSSSNNSKPSATAQTSTNNNTNQTRLEEFVQSTVIEGKKNVKVYDERDVQWSPLALSAISGAFGLNKSHIYSTKFAYVNGIVIDTQESYVAHEGDEITYVIKVVNSGKKVKNNINAYDSIPEGTSLVADSITNNGVEKNGKISWKVSIEAGKTVELSFKVKVNKEITVVKNQATVNGEPTNEVKTPIVTSDKEVQVLDNEGNVIEGATVASAGQTLLYTIRVRNTSDVEGKANIIDTIDDKAVTVDAASITEGGNYSKGTITWNNVSVPANNRAKLQFKATVNPEGEFSLVTNKAEVNGTPTNEVETPIVTSEKQVQVLDNEGNVIEGVTTASSGQTLLYTIRVKNTSNVNGKANISDTIDTNAITVHTSSMTEGGNYSNGIVSWNNITIPANGKAKLQFQATIKSEGGFNLVSNKAEVNGEPSNEVKTPIITSDKEVQVLDSEGNVIEGVTTASAGQTLLYTIRVRNSSEVEGTADVVDTIDTTALTVDSASITEGGNYADGKVTWDNVTVPANNRAKLQFKAVINAEGEFNLVTNKAKVNGEPTNEVKTPIVTSTKDVQVLDSKGNVMEGVTTAMPGQTLLYTIRVFNTSEVEGKANISDSIDTEVLTIDESTITEGGNYANGVVTWNNVTVPTNGRAKLQFKATVASEGEFTLVNNTATINDNDKPEVKTPYITATKTPSVEFAKNGDVYTYTIVVTNHSEISGKATISDKVPEGTSYVPDSIVGGGNYDEATKTITWNNIEVKPGTTTVSFNVKVEKDTVDAIKNTAKVNDHDVPSDDVPVAKVKIDKKLVDEDPNRKYKIGEKVSYVITVTNLGSKDLNNVVVKDDLTVRDSINSKVATVTSIKVGNNNVADFASYISQEDKDGDAILVITIPELKVEDKEAEIKLEYEVTAEDVGVGNHKIINTATVETTETPDPTPIPEDPTVETDNYTNVSVVKEWDDNNNQDGKRANSVFVTLKANGNDADSSLNVTNSRVELNDSNSWKYEWVKVLANKDGRAINYTVVEDDVTFEENGETRKYTSTVETINKTERNTDYKVINKHDPIPYNEDPDDPDVKPGTITITKVWDDSNNQDNKRSSVAFTLFADDTAYNEVTLSENNVDPNNPNVWTYTWKELDKYKDGKEIVYKVVETTIDSDYSSTISQVVPNEGNNAGKATITNTYVVETTSYEVTKVWDDGSNRDGYRSDVEVALKADGKVIKTADTSKASTDDIVIIKNDDNSTWTIKFNNLEVYKAGAVGQKVIYTSEEMTNLDQYTEGAELKSGDYKSTIVNSHETDKTTHTVTKVWKDDNNRDGMQVEEVEVQLYANGEAVGNPVVLKDGNPSFTYTWRDLDKNSNGKEITYSADEVSVPSGYTKEVKTEGNITRITNEHTSEQVNGNGIINVTKVWEDGNNQDGKRVPTDIKLMKKVGNGAAQEVSGKVFTAPGTANTETGKYEGLPKYENGTEIVYSVVENQVAGYETPVITGNQADGFKVTNKHTPELVNIPVKKIWYDNNNFYKARPASITVTLKENGTVTNNTLTISKENVVPNTENNEWQDTFVGLPKYKNGQEIVYSIVENVPNTYESEVSGNSKDGFTITNRYENVNIHRYSLESTEISTEAALVDVVFVLDVSGSMDDWTRVNGRYVLNDRAKNAVAAINEAMASIFAKSQKNRVSVVTFSSGTSDNSRDNAKVLLPLKSYKPAGNDGKYLSFTSNSNSGDDKISISVKEVLDDGSTQNVPAGTATTVTGGTYTQAGIKKGAEVLINAPNKKYTIGNDEYTRAAVMILLTDGEPTFGKNDVPLSNSNSDVSGNGHDVSADLGYYTIKTAAYYKEQISNAYYPKDNGVRPGESQFFTIGYDINDQYTKTVLDPTEANINACDKNDGSTADVLYDYFIQNGSKTQFTDDDNNETYTFSYANKSYTGTMTAEDLSNIMKDIEKEIKHYKENVTHTTNIKKTPAKVKLEMLDATKPITIILDDGTPTSYTLTQLNGVVTQENGEYYIDLNAEMFKDIMSIDISYYDTTTLST